MCSSIFVIKRNGRESQEIFNSNYYETRESAEIAMKRVCAMNDRSDGDFYGDDDHSFDIWEWGIVELTTGVNYVSV